MRNITIPTFQTNRLILRAVTEADATSYQANFATYDVISQLNRSVPWPYPKGGVLEFIKNQILPEQGKSKWVWGITLKDKPNEVIGAIDLSREGKPENRGFFLGKKYWGFGYMTEAVKPIMDYAFNELGFEKLIFANAVGNQRSHRIKEKTGARLIRIEPAEFVDPSHLEREVWELTKQEWLKFSEKVSTF